MLRKAKGIRKKANNHKKWKFIMTSEIYNKLARIRKVKEKCHTISLCIEEIIKNTRKENISEVKKY